MKKLGKYEVLGELGRGAFGIVYRARDPVINRMVALKTMSSLGTGDSGLLQRFYREAQSAGSLQHPNIVTIYDLGEEGGTPYIAMELIEGQNLDDLIARRPPISVSLKVVYGVQACRALDFAHKRGIIHRDIKPANVMVSKEGTVKVVDFGIARVLENSRTQTGMLIGTFSYMAPEVFEGEHANARSDVWSFGVLLYELLAYRRPFTGDSPAALMNNVCMRDPVPLRQLVPECPEDLASVVHRMLLKPEADRYQTMEDVLNELEPISRRLQAQTVEDFVQQSQRAFEQHEFEQARSLLQQALLVDSSNHQARALFEQVNLELKRIALRPNVEEHVAKGRTYLQAGKLHDAGAQAGDALNLDSSFGPAQELQREVQREMARVRQVNEWLQLLKQRLVEGLPEEAEVLLARVQQADPGNAQLPALQQQVAEERARRQKRLELSASLQQARALWSQGQYEECIDLLTRLQKDDPQQEEIGRLLDTARADQAEHRREIKLADARRLLAAQSFEECLALLAKVEEEFPGDAEIEKLLAATREQFERRQKLDHARALVATQQFTEAMSLLDPLLAADSTDSAVLKLRALVQREQENQARLQSLRREWDSLKGLVSDKAWSEVVARGEELLRRYPSEADLARMVDFARKQQAQSELDSKLRRSVDQIEALMSGGRFSEACDLARAALDSSPDNPELASLLHQAEAREKKERVRQLIEQRVREIRSEINAGKLTEATHLAEETLETLGPDTAVRQLLTTAVVEREAREKRRLQDQRLQDIRSLVTSGRLGEAATRLNDAMVNGSFDALDPRLNQVANEIEDLRKAAAASTAGTGDPAPPTPAREYVLEGPPPEEPGAVVAAAAAARDQTATPGAGTATTGASIAMSGTVAWRNALPLVEKQLAMFIGPLARVVVKRAASRTNDPEELYRMLAASLEREADREAFLARKLDMTHMSVTAAPVAGSQMTEPSMIVPAGTPATELSREELERAARLLARHVGPISRVVVRGAAARAGSVSVFYQLLAEHVTNEPERAQFLRDAGFPAAN